MKVVYVLVSDETDVYLEQSLISILSLRRNNPDVYIYLLIDKKTEKTIRNDRAKIYDYINKIVIVDVPDTYNKKDKSRFLKTSMYFYIPEDFLYIDADTVICDNIGEIDRNYLMASVLDKHYPISEHPLKEEIYKQAYKCGYHVSIDDCYFNSGLIWAKKCEITEKFFKTWHKLWKKGLSKGVTQDQPSYNETNYRMNGLIKEIDGVWNCQISNQTRGLQFLNKAKIIHYFASYGNNGAPYDLSNNEIIKSVISVPDARLDFILENPKDAFSTIKYIINDKDDEEVLQSPVFKRLRYLKKKRPIQFEVINGCSYVLNYIQNKSLRYLVNKVFITLNKVVKKILLSLICTNFKG